MGYKRRRGKEDAGKGMHWSRPGGFFPKKIIAPQKERATDNARNWQAQRRENHNGNSGIIV